jgi:hypothetical protein
MAEKKNVTSGYGSIVGVLDSMLNHRNSHVTNCAITEKMTKNKMMTELA